MALDNSRPLCAQSAEVKNSCVDDIAEDREVNKPKRQHLKTTLAAGIGTVAVLNDWTKPLVDTIVLPAHAQTSGPTFAINGAINVSFDPDLESSQIGMISATIRSDNGLSDFSKAELDIEYSSLVSLASEVSEKTLRTKSKVGVDGKFEASLDNLLAKATSTEKTATKRISRLGYSIRLSLDSRDLGVLAAQKSTITETIGKPSFSLENVDISFMADLETAQTALISGTVKNSGALVDLSTTNLSFEYTSLNAEAATVSEKTLTVTGVKVDTNGRFSAKVGAFVAKAVSADKLITKSVSQFGYKANLFLDKENFGVIASQNVDIRETVTQRPKLSLRNVVVDFDAAAAVNTAQTATMSAVIENTGGAFDFNTAALAINYTSLVAKTNSTETLSLSTKAGVVGADGSFRLKLPNFVANASASSKGASQSITGFGYEVSALSGKTDFGVIGARAAIIMNKR